MTPSPSKSAHLLLTGAGFSRNFGGWLAKEVEGDLLARVASDEQLRRLIQDSQNYEDALGKARSAGKLHNWISADQLKVLENAIRECFWAMNIAPSKRCSMFSSGSSNQSVVEFLARFDAIFTLNQGLLLEYHYNAAQIPIRWAGSYYPGIDPAIPTPLNAAEFVRVERRVGAIGPVDPQRQPIYKLHGSIEWTDGTDSLFVVGGDKIAYIRSRPLLKRSFEIFEEHLRRPGARLMIVGYGFSDEHINQILVESSAANPSLRFFHVHPDGRDAAHRGLRERKPIYQSAPVANLPCVGESRRPLTTTFGGDDLEFNKLMRFFA
jgi:hypothetical protein